MSTYPVINKITDCGNNETWVRGVFPQADGTFTAITFATSKTFKTRKGAERWYNRVTA